MKFSSAGLVESLVWNLRLADLPRGTNRAQIDRLANGLPPYTAAEQQSRNIKTNVNWLEFPELLADARRSYYNAFLKPGGFFNVRVDYGKPHEALAWSKQITKCINRLMKRSLPYFEFVRSQAASTVLHGIGPGFWSNHDSWVPRCIGIEDVMIPSDTLLTMENLAYFAIFRQYTAMELYQATHQKSVDPAWNIPVVDAALQWADSQWWKEQSYSELFAPQKVEERWKQDLGFYGTDAIPTIDAWDFYFWSDEGGKSGWRRRMILDTPATWEVTSRRKMTEAQRKMPDKNMIGDEHGQWLYNPGDDRVYADKRDQILHFQFADTSAVAPFKYHTVRSLGWLLYAVCHLQNRLRSKVNDAIFESLLQYFRTSNPDDKERILKIDLHDFGVVPEGVAFVRPEERWQVNQQLVEMGLTLNQQRMQASAAQYREGRQQETDKREKTATQIMAEVNSANALVGAMLSQAYQYKTFEYNEIGRRFCRKNSQDADVREFRAEILKKCPEECLEFQRWEIEPERVLGSGNKTLEIAMADKLMAARPLHDPEAQREILYLYDMANTDNPDMAERLATVEKDRVSDSVHEAQLMVGTLMQGVPVLPTKGQNATEIIETLLGALAQVIKRVQTVGIPKPDDIIGLQTMVQAIRAYMETLAEDNTVKEKVKAYEKALGMLEPVIAKMQQALMKAQPPVNGNGGPDPKDAAKAQAMVIQAKTKAALQAQSHQQRTTERDVQFRMKMQQDAEKHQQDLAKQEQQGRLDTALKGMQANVEMKRRMKTSDES